MVLYWPCRSNLASTSTRTTDFVPQFNHTSHILRLLVPVATTNGALSATESYLPENHSPASQKRSTYTEGDRSRMLRIVAGTYEGLLYGWELPTTAQQQQPQAPSKMKLTFGYSAHAECIKSVALMAAKQGKTLLSGGADEMIKCVAIAMTIDCDCNCGCNCNGNGNGSATDGIGLPAGSTTSTSALRWAASWSSTAPSPASSSSGRATCSVAAPTTRSASGARPTGTACTFWAAISTLGALWLCSGALG